MLTSTKLKIRMSETREAYNDVPREDNPVANAQREKLEAELKALEGEYRDAERAESKATEGFEPSESHEVRELVHRAEGEFRDRLRQDRSIIGTSMAHSLSCKVFYNLPQHLIPLRLLREDRASITGLTDEPSASPTRPALHLPAVRRFLHGIRHAHGALWDTCVSCHHYASDHPQPCCWR